TVVGQAQATAAGAYTVTLSTALSSGTYNITGKAVDFAGNAGPASGALAITIDTGALAPSVPRMTAATDTGSSNADGVTNNTTPTFTGTAEPNAAVSIVATGTGSTAFGPTVVGTAVANGTGAYSVTLSTALGNGTYSIQAGQTDV